jgi:phosphoesterase RecJ-like protein
VSQDLLLQLIKRFDTITIFGHVFPDGDCYGSQIGLKEAIKTTYPHKAVYALGSGYENFHDLITPMDRVDDAIIAQSLALVVDVADAPRIEDQRYQTAQVVFKIDHHIPLYQFGNHQWVDTTMIAVAEMITSFVINQRLKLSTKGAMALALGLITDSGRFLYGQVTSHTFDCMSQLVKMGADLHLIYDRLYEKSFKSMSFESYVYQNYKTTPNGLIYCVFSKEQLRILDMDAVRAASRVNLLSNIRYYPVWAFFAEDDQDVRCEFRSAGPDVQTIAYKYGGGGHLQASGCHVKQIEQINQIIAAIDAMLDKESHT